MRKLLLNMGDGLPVKTRIAVWFILLTGIVGIITTIVIIVLTFAFWPSASFGIWEGIIVAVLIFRTLVAGCLYLVPGFLLILKSKLAYAASIVILIVYSFLIPFFVAVLFEQPYCNSIPIFVVFLILISLIMLDVKNYWKISN